MSNCEYLLQIFDLCKHYPGVKALDNVCFDLKPGEVHALIGENGAGKSTLIKIVMGIVPRDSGTILLENQPINVKNAHEARKLGITAVFQELSQIPSLSVAENLFIKQEIKKFGVFIDRKSIYKKAKELLDYYEIDIDPRQLVSEIPIAKRQLVEILKATACKPKILILDEPTSALTEGEAQKLFKLIRNLKQNGTGIIYISHRMNEISAIADRATILRDGVNVTQLDAADFEMGKIVKYMVGRETELYIPESRRKYIPRTDTPVLEAIKISQKNGFKNLSFYLNKGEILGIAGLVGSGRTELMQAIFGIMPIDSGELVIEGESVRINNVRDALKCGIAMVPENRHLQGLILIHSIMDNIGLLTLKNHTRFGFLHKRSLNKFADEQIKKFAIKTESRNKLANYLSGGNQQKVVIAKWLSTNPKILIVDEPTSGIDVNAKAEIHRSLRSLAEAGMSIIMISSEMPELLNHSDRVLVMNRNKIIAVLNDTNQEEIMSLIMQDNSVNREV